LSDRDTPSVRIAWKEPSRFADELGPLMLIHIWRPTLSLKAIVAIENIVCGPAIGGFRILATEPTPAKMLDGFHLGHRR
jgi:hypothetical protein